QTVWNAAHGFAPDHGIRDVDVVYFDPGDLSAGAEHAVEERLRRHLAAAGVAVRLDVTNEARVHLWYEERFGVPLAPYRSTCDAIATWPATAGSVGVRPADGDEADGAEGRGHGDGLVVCAPFGLDDLLGLVVRPNRVLVTEEVYAAKAARWRAAWPRLRVLDW
ncbi:MAG TPA: nucleotidyltransferase family protein, partial [Acidimicrobiales bacterium]